MIRCYIGLGSNQASPLAQIYGALNALRRLPGSRLVESSRFYGSRAIGPGEQPDYINAVAALDTALSPEDLLAALQRIEHQHGRKRDVRWGARTLDLDILLYGEQYIDNSTLQIPHPRMPMRPFVLAPLADLSEELARQHSQLSAPADQWVGSEELWLIGTEELSQYAE